MYPRKGQIDKARFQKAMEAKARSKTFPGIADAMAQQWGAVLGGDTAEP